MGARLGEREILFGALPRSFPSTRVGAGGDSVVTVLRIIFGDQLSLDLSALDALDPGSDTILMMEVMEENTYVRHHKQKIVLVLAAMRHFAETLRERGLTVDSLSVMSVWYRFVLRICCFRVVGVHMATPGLVSETPWNHVNTSQSTPFETASKAGTAQSCLVL